MFPKLWFPRVSDDNRLLTTTVNTSNEHNSCFPLPSWWQLHYHYLVGVIQTSGLNIVQNVSIFSESQKRRSSQAVCFNCHALWVSGWFVIPNIALVRLECKEPGQGERVLHPYLA